MLNNSKNDLRGMTFTFEVPENLFLTNQLEWIGLTRSISRGVCWVGPNFSRISESGMPWIGLRSSISGGVHVGSSHHLNAYQQEWNALDRPEK